MKMFFKALFLVPIAIVVLAFAFANRQPVSVLFDPFNTAQPAFSLTAPFFLVLFATVIVGVLIGGSASWLSQGRVRREARQQRAEADRLRVELSRVRSKYEPSDGNPLRLLSKQDAA